MDQLPSVPDRPFASGLYSGLPICPRCGGKGMPSPQGAKGARDVYWDCLECTPGNRGLTPYFFSIPPESHFLKCPWCFRLKDAKECSHCQGRGWLRL